MKIDSQTELSQDEAWTTSDESDAESTEHNYWELVVKYGSPLLILDQAAVRKQYRSLVRALPDV